MLFVDSQNDVAKRAFVMHLSYEARVTCMKRTDVSRINECCYQPAVALICVKAEVFCWCLNKHSCPKRLESMYHISVDNICKLSCINM